MIGAKLKALREQHGLSQKELAVKLGKSQETISSWENDRTYPKMAQLKELCNLYGCTYETLTGIKQHDAQDITFDDILIRVSQFDLIDLQRLEAHVRFLISQQEEVLRIEREKERLEEELKRLQSYKDKLMGKNNTPPEGNESSGAV